MLAKARFLTQQRGMAMTYGLVTQAFHRALRPLGPVAPAAQRETVRRRFDALLRRDWDNAQRHLYPKRLLFRLPIAEHLRALPIAAADLPRLLLRAARRRTDDLPRNIDRSRYPSYYLRNFHWQTDGWLSERSARLYDFGVDILFGGAADVMRRMALPAVLDNVRNLEHPRILDVACGTGRLLKMLHTARSDAQLYGVDLSPYYLDRARSRGIPNLSLAVENAESLPYRDNWFDALTIVFLFHELPRDARRKVLAEARRVVRPGGVVAILDSAQLSDSAEISWFLESFHRMYHEPYYKGYLDDDLGKAMTEAGLIVASSEPLLVSKLVVGHKPTA